jgi:hypothetical protein
MLGYNGASTRAGGGQRERFLQSYAPSLSKIGYEHNILSIRDMKRNKIAEIYLRDRTLCCNICKSKDCMHVHHALALPEVAKIFLRKPVKTER